MLIQRTAVPALLADALANTAIWIDQQSSQHLDYWETGLSRVKVHRIVKNLETKKLIIKQPYGMTNKVVLKK